MFNIQLAGFYRVSYDPHTWNLLIDDMISCEFADIHPLNRAQLLDDAFTLASAGYLNYTTALNLSQYLAHETDIIPWTTAFDIFKTLEAKLIGTPARPLFRRYIQMLVSNWYSSLSFDDDATPECDTSQLTRMTVVALACGFGHHGCVDRALKQVYLLMSEAETQIPTDLEDILLCTAVNAGPEEVWQFVRKQYMSTTSRKKRESYLEAMACSQDPSKIMQMLEDSLDVKSEFFKNNEGNTLIGALVRRKTNSETMLNFFYKNAEEISALYGPEDLQNYFMFATLHMNPIQIDELHSFMEGKMKQLNLTGINKVFSIEKYISTMKQTEVNTWYASYYHDIYRWLLQENETLETESTVDTTLSTRPIDTSTQHIDSTTSIDTTKVSTLDYVTEDYESTTDNGMSGAGEGEIDYDDDDNEDDDDDDSEDGGEEKEEEKHEEESDKEIDRDEVGKEGESASASGLRSMLRTVMLVPILCILVFS
ncbi:thyrotropin-releasing hormone-degrading ectoenzyme-like [Nilaparvata lugens]|uniref:thyrotropin-releasing hormone-degrading ectoenzyme-like n=1 Tax=Nilaparvata lugens TaxID=108931 RepID=UPI00193EAF4E|nr:thyrotropin-releasing hormone-degrading ectoenzyme-like [Nilaparvata lugens]